VPLRRILPDARSCNDSDRIIVLTTQHALVMCFTEQDHGAALWYHSHVNTLGNPKSRTIRMADPEIEQLHTAIKRQWSRGPSPKAKPYVKAFFAAIRTGTKITAKAVGNHGTYTVSIQLNNHSLTSACSCYIGKHGYCHHCEALALTFLSEPDGFKVITPKPMKAVQSLPAVSMYLQNHTLDALLKELKAHGITQTAFAESIGMATRHLSIIKASELRNRYFNELGATKLACLWVLEHLGKTKRR
jgi:hypothetical protein